MKACSHWRLTTAVATSATASRIGVLAIAPVAAVGWLGIGLRVGTWKASESAPREASITAVAAKGSRLAVSLAAKPSWAPKPSLAPGTACDRSDCSSQFHRNASQMAATDHAVRSLHTDLLGLKKAAQSLLGVNPYAGTKAHA